MSVIPERINSPLLSRPQKKEHRLARIDGIRAIAVTLIVILHHSMLSRLGWVGVDLFFVLSGFLITSILLQTRQLPDYWSSFYIKRCCRILPPLLIILMITPLLFRHLTLPGFLGYLFFFGDVMNTTRWSIAPLGCLWSLAIEEHFYLVVPFLVRSLRLRGLAMLFVGIVVLEPVLRGAAFLAHLSSASIYYLTPFRMDGLALGGLLACVIKSGVGEVKLRRFGGWLSLTLWLFFVLLASLNSTFAREQGSFAFEAFGYSLVALASFLTISHVYWYPVAPLSKLLALAPIAYIGRISYGIYLFHPLILSIARHALGISAGLAEHAATSRLFIIDFPLTVVAASLSFWCIESPALEWGRRRVHALASKESPLVL